MEERGELVRLLDISATGIYPGQFGNVWREAVALRCGDSSNLVRSLNALATAPDYAQKSPLSIASDVLADVARRLAERGPVAEPVVDEAEPEKPTSERYEVDLRSQTSNVVNMNAQ